MNQFDKLQAIIAACDSIDININVHHEQQIDAVTYIENLRNNDVLPENAEDEFIQKMIEKDHIIVITFETKESHGWYVIHHDLAEAIDEAYGLAVLKTTKHSMDHPEFGPLNDNI